MTRDDDNPSALVAMASGALVLTVFVVERLRRRLRIADAVPIPERG